MANKTLTATVKFETKSAERSLKNLAKKINDVQNAINKASKNNTKFTTQINKATTAQNRLTAAANKTASATEKINTANKKAVNSANQLNRSYNSANRSASNLGTTIKRLAATYLGVMGMKAITSTSDTITSTQNKLNALNGNDKNLTQEQMDKMYVSSSKVRMDYTDMLSNASKSMTLAGGAFQNNMDNAIRFQEIMAETYALGGASAPEMSNSMYQLIQALGSGQLAGDELRAVREGAPLAYQEIEKFAQKTLNSTESLKELASQGKITSDMVVAAVMSAGDEIDKRFEETAWTFGAVWNRIKSAAVKAFEPVSNQLSDMLNRVAESGIFEKMEQAFWNLSKVIQIVFALIESAISWLVDNWNWLKYVVIFALTAIGLYLLYVGYQAVSTAVMMAASWIMANGSLLLTIGIIALIVVALVWLANQCSSVCDFIYQLCVALAWAIVGVLAAVLAVYLATGTIMLSVPTLIALAVIGVLLVIIAAFVKYTGEIVGGIYGIWEVCKNVCQDIGTFFSNLWYGTKAEFWNFIGAVLSGLSDLEPAFNAIAELFGLEGVTLSGIISNVKAREDDARSKIKDYNGISIAESWSTGYEKGYAKGEKIQDSINSWKDKLGGFSLDGIGEKLGLNFGDGFPSGAEYNVDGSYTIPDTLGNIEDNTSSIADSMDLNKDDLEYLRKVAEMEWRNEFTTAEIRVDMTNNNTVNSERDLDGIVEYLSDVLRSEMTNVAYGVHY